MSYSDLLSAPAVKLLVRKPGMPSSELAAALGRHVGVLGDITYSTNDGLIEISPIGISKAVGVEEVARPLEISAEDVVAFGDMPNDVPMLRWAWGTGWPWATPTPTPLPPPTRSPPRTATTGWRARARTLVAVAG